METRIFSWARNLALLVPLLFVTDSTSSFDDLLTALEKQTYDYVQEKVYLHLDKPYYSKGDNLWFKAYTVAGPNHTPTPLSENLYVELIDPDGNVLKRSTIYLNKGMGNGDFAMADSLVTGDYTIRAYTNWMRNFDEAFFFQKRVKLLNPIDFFNDETTKSENKTEIRFFPEGGELVANVPGLVAFELLGSGQNQNGEILDEQGNVVSKFKASHEGRGLFSLTPRTGKSYFARLTGQSEQFELPVAQTDGLVLSVDNNTHPEQVIVSIKSARNGVNKKAYLIAHTRGLVGYANKVEWKGTTARLKIPKNELAPGVVQLTVFNENWLPEAERLIYQPVNQEMIQVDLTTDRDEYVTRDSTTVKLKLTSQDGQPIRGFFSVNTYDTNQISPSAFEEDIVSSLLLSSDIKGNIQNPSQYFDEQNALASRHLDLLLLTKGWRRFTWKDILNDKFPEISHEVEQGFNVTGRVSQRGNKKVVAKGLVKQIGNFGGIPVFQEATTNSKGEFEMNNLLYYEEVGLVQAEDKKGKTNVRIELDTVETATFYDQIDMPEPALWEKIEIQEDFITRGKERISIDSAYSFENVTDLGTVVVEGTKNNVLSSNAARGLVFNRGEYGLDVSDIMSNGQKFVNALYILQGRVPGITISAGAIAGEPFVQMNRKVWSIQNPDPPIQYFIDDMPVDISAITAMPAERIQRIEILKGMRATGIYGPVANGGAIIFYTKTGQEWDDFFKKLTANGITSSKNVQSLKGGYYHSRQFYAPNYSQEIPEHIKPDRRDLIHWEPMIQTDENGEAEFTFFNADIETTIQVQLEGIWEGGIPLAKSINYEVKRK